MYDLGLSRLLTCYEYVWIGPRGSLRKHKNYEMLFSATSEKKSFFMAAVERKQRQNKIQVMSVRAEHRAWTQAHGAGAHEVLAAIAAGASELVDPTDDFPAAGSGGRNGSTRARRSDRDEIGRGSEQAGVAGAEVGWTAHGAMGSSATVAAAGPASDGGGAQRFAGQQWSPYYQQQVSERLGGLASW